MLDNFAAIPISARSNIKFAKKKRATIVPGLAGALYRRSQVTSLYNASLLYHAYMSRTRRRSRGELSSKIHLLKDEDGKKEQKLIKLAFIPRVRNRKEFPLDPDVNCVRN